MSIARLRPAHIVANNAPMIAMIFADDFCSAQRTFNAAGAPNVPGMSTNLKPGNNKFQGQNSGCLSGFAINAGGAAYKPNDVLTPAGGAGTAASIIVDSVDATGRIIDGHFTVMGNYTTLPAQTNALTGGTGAGAIFNLYPPIPDLYIDTTAQAMYVCTTAGTALTSVWKQISGGTGGGNYSGTWNPNTPYTAGMIARVKANYSAGGINATLGVFGCVIPGPGTAVTTTPAVGLDIPQFPEPAVAHWELITLPPQAVSDCTNTNVSVYVHGSQVF